MTESKIMNVGHQRCTAYDDINLSMCYNCGRTGHVSKNYKNEKACLICAGNHKAENCTDKKNYKCI